MEGVTLNKWCGGEHAPLPGHEGTRIIVAKSGADADRRPPHGPLEKPETVLYPGIKIVGFHDATRLATLHNSAMPGPLTPRHKGTVCGDDDTPL